MMFIKNKQIVEKIGPETAMFYRRYAPFVEQAKVVNRQIGTPVEIALAGLLHIHLGEQFRFDPLAIPWLN